MQHLVPTGLLAYALLLVASSAGAADCYTQYDSRNCLQQEKSLQAQLDQLQMKQEQMYLNKLKDYEQEFKNEVVATIRETNAAFARFKDSECYSSLLIQGMSLRDSGVQADACRVQWRVKHAAELQKRTALPTK